MAQRKLRDLAHQVFGELTVMKEAERRVYSYGKKSQYVRVWECRCACGSARIVSQADLVSGHTKSCGCRKVRHGIATLPEYNVWQKIVRRCENSTDKSFPDYGGRGIRVCERWRKSPKVFLDDMGPRPTAEHTIERINNDGDYSPDNCRWALRVEQANNKRSNRLLTHDGQTQTLSIWAKQLHTNPETLRNRIKKGWTDTQVLSIPITPNGCRARLQLDTSN